MPEYSTTPLTPWSTQCMRHGTPPYEPAPNWSLVFPGKAVHGAKPARHFGCCCSSSPGASTALWGLCGPPQRKSFTSHGLLAAAFPAYFPHHFYCPPSSSTLPLLPHIFSSPHRHRLSPTAPFYDCFLSPSPPIHSSLLASESNTSTLARYP